MEQETSLIGTTIGHYSIIDYLGKGSMGEVYLGIHPTIKRKVAVKVLSSSLSARADMVSRFTVEAESVNRINHPNIIEVFDFGELPDGRLYLIMEFLDGKDLETVLKKGPLPLEEVRACFEKLASALNAAHEEGIVHRDLKPENIFIGKTKVGLQVKILDFGIAKLFDLSEEGAPRVKTQRGMIMGTPLYMSPEQAKGEVDRISPQSDIYSLAIIIYKMLSGHFPIEGKTVYNTLAMQATAPPVPITDFCPDLGGGLWHVLATALEKQPLNRYPSVALFYQAFLEATREPFVAPTPIEPAKVTVPRGVHELRPVEESALTPRGAAQLQPSLELEDVGRTKPKLYAVLPNENDLSTQRGGHTPSRRPPKRRRRGGALLFIVALLIAGGISYGYYQWALKKYVAPISVKRKVLQENAILMEDLAQVTEISRAEKKQKDKVLFQSLALLGGSTLFLSLIIRKLTP